MGNFGKKFDDDHFNFNKLKSKKNIIYPVVINRKRLEEISSVWNPQVIIKPVKKRSVNSTKYIQ